MDKPPFMNPKQRDLVTMATRRDALRLFGVGAAVVANSDSGAPEVFNAADVGPGLSPLSFSGNQYDTVAGLLYSQISIERNSMENQYTFFQLSIGSPDGRGGYCDMAVTNLFRPGQLPPPDHFLVERVGVLFSPTMPRGLAASVADCFQFELRLGDKIFFRAPLAAVSSMRNLGSDPLEVGVRLGDTSPPLGELGNRPLLIEPLNHFAAIVNGRKALATHGKVVMWAYLSGKHLRSRV
jgi:hypothetical protein